MSNDIHWSDGMTTDKIIGRLKELQRIASEHDVRMSEIRRNHRNLMARRRRMEKRLKKMGL